MNSRQESKLNMYRAVKLLLDNNLVIITPNIAFMSLYNAFKAKLSTLITTAASEAEIITGITTDKTVAKKNLAENGSNIAAIVYAYANSINDNQLRESVNFSYSDLYRIKDDLLPPTCQNIHDIAAALIVPLGNYGVDAPMLASFQSAIAGYSIAVPKPRNARNVKETYSKNIRALIKAIDSLLKEEMDKAITIFKVSDPDLLSSYQFARIIIDPATHATQLKGLITRADDNSPLKGVKVEITGPDSSFKMTDDNGNFSFKPAKFGNYQITVTHDGYEPYTLNTFKVLMGKVNTLNIKLQSA